MKRFNIGYVGLTHLGLNYLAASVEKNFFVLGLDDDKNKIKKLKSNIFDYKEPNLKETILKNKKRIFFSNDFNDLKKCELVFIAKDVSTNKNGISDLKNLKSLISKTIRCLRKDSTLVILSQIKPGFMKTINYEKKKLYHQVETLIFGKAINRALHPERIIIGCHDKIKKINGIYGKYLNSFKCPILKMSYESAEITKISINLLLASSVTITNILSEICEKMSADWQDVMPALKLDKRIGKFSYIKPGLGIAGGNIERDIVTIKNMSKKGSPHYSLLENMLENSNYMRLWVNRIMNKKKFLNKKNKTNIGIIGAAYKENTNSIKNSPSIHLLQYLKKYNSISIYEPMLNLELKNKNVKQEKNLKILLKKSKIIILMRPWGKKKDIQYICNNIKNKLIIDPYRVLNLKDKAKKNNKYFTIGKS